MTQWVECVPNFSEGSRLEIIDAIVAAITSEGSARILDVSADRWHNRSVVTYAVPVDAAVRTAFTAIKRSMELIDLRSHAGVHPRFGATDVFPFVPLGNTTISQCVKLARELATHVGAELKVPVYLYEDAALVPERRNLADLRRMLRERQPGTKADRGPSEMHPTFGAVAIGARTVLVAFNVYVGDASMLPAAARIARRVREASGGLKAVKAIPLLVDGQAQVSMNLVDIDITSMRVAFETVASFAKEVGAPITRSEVVGLVPERAFEGATPEQLKLDNFDTGLILERRLNLRVPELQTIGDWLSDLAKPDSSPAGGQAAAYSAATAAALLEMLAGIALRKAADQSGRDTLSHMVEESSALRGQIVLLGAEDAEAYSELENAMRAARRGNSGEAKGRDNSDVSQAALRATMIPLRIAQMSARLAEIAAQLAAYTSASAIPDCMVAAMLATTAARGSHLNVRANATLLRPGMNGDELVAQASGFADSAGHHEDKIRMLSPG